MAEEWSTRLRESQRIFSSIVWPRVEGICGGGSITPVEGVSKRSITRSLDALAGIDAWQQLVDPEAGDAIRGIASRVQFDPPNGFDTFTVRYQRANGRPTEYQKRLAALESDRGLLFPHLTIQAYVPPCGSRLLRVAVARTEDIITACRENLHQVRRCRDGSASFLWVGFEQVAACRVVYE